MADIFVLCEHIESSGGPACETVAVSSDWTVLRDMWDDRSDGERVHEIIRLPLKDVLQAIGELREQGVIA